jgi:hypothetical protein
VSELLAYLLTQARRRPLGTARFAAGELLRRARLRWSDSLEDALPDFAAHTPAGRLAPFLAPGCRDAEALRRRLPDAAAQILKQADGICRHEFSLFGERYSLGQEIQWHADPETGHDWPLAPPGQLRLLAGPPGTDVKRPWELARFHQALALGQAHCISRDSRYFAEFEQQVLGWMRSNPYPRGIHWAMPMEVALRAINWITAAAFFAEAVPRDAQFWPQFFASLFLHGRYLYVHREWNPVARGNHYLACVVGLVYLGLLFNDTPEGHRWLELGRRALGKEMSAQVGEDGVAHEGSSGYHAFVTELMLAGALPAARAELLRHGIGVSPIALRDALEGTWGNEFVGRLGKMFEFLAALVEGREHPPIWGDSDDGRVLPFCGCQGDAARHLLGSGSALFEPPHRPAPGDACHEAWWQLGVPPGRPAAGHRAAPMHGFVQAGFFFFSSPRLRGSIRCGPLGVNGWANHAHCDQLSFEFCWEGRPILTDAGTYCYSGNAAARNLFRSTCYHNTVLVNEEEQNRYWPGLLFRMVDDTRSRLLYWRQCANRIEFGGLHHGYQRLKQRVAVQRHLALETRDDVMCVADTVRGRGTVRLDWFFHLAPDVVLQPWPQVARWTRGRPPWLGLFRDDLEGLALDYAWRLGPVALLVWSSVELQPLRSAIEEGWLAPRYGQRVEAPLLRLTCKPALPARMVFTFGPAETLVEDA